MKKIGMSLYLLIFMLLSLNFIISPEVRADTLTTVFLDNFETKEDGITPHVVGDVPDGWVNMRAITQASDPLNSTLYSTGNMLVVPGLNTPNAYAEFLPCYGNVVVEFKIKGYPTSVTTQYYSVGLSNGASTNNSSFLVWLKNINAKLQYNNIAEVGTISNAQAWYSYKIVLNTNLSTNNVMIYQDGILKGTFTNTNIINNKISRIYFGSLASVDDVKVSAENVEIPEYIARTSPVMQDDFETRADGEVHQVDEVADEWVNMQTLKKQNDATNSTLTAMGHSPSLANNVMPDAYREFIPTSSKVVAEFSIRGYSEVDNVPMVVIASGTTNLFTLMNTNGTLTYNGNSLGSFNTVGSWYKVKMELYTNLTTKNLRIYVNNFLIGTYDDTTIPTKTINRIYFGSLAEVDDVAVSGEVVDSTGYASVITSCSTQVEALAETTQNQKYKKQTLRLAVEQANYALVAGYFIRAQELVSDINTTVPLTLGGAVTSQTFFKPLNQTTQNPYLTSVYSSFDYDKTVADSSYPKSTDTSCPFPDFNASRSAGSSIYTYLWLTANPESLRNGDTEAFIRAKRRADSYLDSYVTMADTSTLRDWFSFGQALNGAVAFQKTFPDHMLPSEKKMWRAAFNRGRIEWDNWYNSYSDWASYANRDFGCAVGYSGLYNYFGDAALKTKYETILNLWSASGYFYPDGAFSYITDQNESGGYHGVDIGFLENIYRYTGNQKALDFIKASENYGLLSVEPGNVGEYYTAPTWKTNWNGGTSTGGEVVAGTTGNPYLRTLIDVYGSEYKSASLTSALYYKYVTPKQLPDNYIVYDRNIEGPRGRFGKFSFGGTARVFGSKFVGKTTYTGAMMVGSSELSLYHLNAALYGVFPSIKLKNGTAEWNTTGMCTENERNSLSIGKTFSALATAHDLTGQDAGPTRWTTNWDADQQWLYLPDRIIGMVETFPQNDGEKAYNVTGRIRLGYSEIGEKQTINAIDSNNYTYGNFNIKLHENNYGIISTAPASALRNEMPQLATDIVLKDDRSATDSSTLQTYNKVDKYYYITEVSPNTTALPATVERIADENVRGFKVDLNNKRYVLIHNTTSSVLSYSISGLMMPNRMNSVFFARETGLSPISPAPLSVNIPANSHIVIVYSDESDDQANGWTDFPTMMSAMSNSLVYPSLQYQTLYTQNFEKKTDGTNYSSGNAVSDWTGATIKVSADLQNNYIQGTVKSSAPNTYKTFTVNGKVNFDFKLKGYTSTTTYDTVVIYQGTNKIVSLQSVSATMLYNGDVNYPLTSMTNTSKWYNYRIELDTKAKTNNLKLYIDGVLKYTITSSSVYGSAPNKIAFGSLASLDDLNITFLDNSIINETFEKSSTGTEYAVNAYLSSSDWSSSSRIARASDVENDTNYIVGSSTSSGSTGDPTTVKTLPNLTGKFAISFRLRGYSSTMQSNTVNICSDTSGSTSSKLFALKNVNSSLRYNGLINASEMDIKNKWYDYKIVVDTTAQTNNVEIYVNNRRTVLATNPAVYGAIIKSIGFGYLATLDDLFVAYSSSNVTDITSSVYNVDQIMKTITIRNSTDKVLSTFKSNISAPTGATYKIFKEDAITEVTGEPIAEGYKVVCIAQDGVAVKTYTVKMVTMWIDIPTFSGFGSSNIQSTINIANNTDVDKNANLIMALYNKDKLVKVILTTNSEVVIAKKTEKIQSVGFSASITAPITDYKVKIYLLDGLTEIRPLIQSVTYTP